MNYKRRSECGTRRYIHNTRSILENMGDDPLKPNYYALMACIFNWKLTADDALRAMEVYTAKKRCEIVNE